MTNGPPGQERGMSLFAVIAAKSLPWAVIVGRRQPLACYVDACIAGFEGVSGLRNSVVDR
jgi:hypothetical protein